MKTINEIEEYAKKEYIPIARKQVIEYILNLINENNYKSVLEVGTAIGYTSSVIKLNFPTIKLTTLEKNLERANMAKENFTDLGILNDINFIIGDATKYTTNTQFDFIFIDASKKKNKFYLDKFTPNLSKNGTIIIDNMNLDDLWVNCHEKKKKMFDKVNDDLKQYVLTNPLYDAKLYNDIGDGILVIKKR